MPLKPLSKPFPHKTLKGLSFDEKDEPVRIGGKDLVEIEHEAVIPLTTTKKLFSICRMICQRIRHDDEDRVFLLSLEKP